MQPEMTIFDAPDITWCNNTFDMLRDGGVWGVPRSGLTFTKEGDKFVLTDKMPWIDACPMSEEDWAKYQDEDYEQIRFYFALAGIPVESRVG